MLKKKVPFSSWQLWIKNELHAANRRFEKSKTLRRFEKRQTHRSLNTNKTLRSFDSRKTLRRSDSLKSGTTNGETMFSFDEKDILTESKYEVVISKVNRG